MKTVGLLIHNADFCRHVTWREQFGYLVGNLLVGERFVNVFHIIHNLFLRQILLFFCLLVGFLNYGLHIFLLKQCNCRLERNKFTHSRHINAVAVGVADLRRRRHNHNLFRVQAVEHTDNALFERGSANNAVVNHHKIVLVRHNTAVSYIVHVRRQIVAGVAFRNERAQFYVFYRHFLKPNATGENAVQFVGRDFVALADDFLFLERVQILFKTFKHTVECDFGGIWNEREHRVVNIVVNGFENSRDKVFAQFLAFLVNVGIATTREIDPLERARLFFLRADNLRSLN